MSMTQTFTLSKKQQKSLYYYYYLAKIYVKLS